MIICSTLQPSHAWGSGPTSALSKYVLGVRPVTPGYKTWLVEPQPGDLKWAKGTVPTPSGSIEVRWEKEGNGFALQVTVPDGTRGSVGLPVGANPGSLIVNGRSVKKRNGHRSRRIRIRARLATRNLPD